MKPILSPGRPGYLVLVAALVVGLLLAGCNPLKSLSNGEAQPTAAPTQPARAQTGTGTGASANANASTDPSTPTAAPSVTEASDVVGQGIMPGGMPACVPGSPTAEPAVQPSPVITPFVIYKGGELARGWSEASWGGVKPEMQSNEAQREGHPTVKVTYPDGWGAFSLADWNDSNSADTSRYSHLRFWVNGGQAGGQVVGVLVYTDGGEGQRLHVEKYIAESRIPANKWQEVLIPLDDLGAGGAHSSRVAFQEVSGKAQPPYYLDCIEFYKDSSPPPTPIVSRVSITVDLGANRKPISPLVYGLSQAPENVVKDANITLNRQGGNATSTYNWTLGNARNAGSDWEFRNYSREGDDPAYKQSSGLADTFFRADKRNGAETLLTVPMIGYIAKNDDNDTRSTGMPTEGGPPVSPGSEAIPGYDPRQNQERTSVRSLPRKGAPFADPPNRDGSVYQDEWIGHLVRTFGRAADGGVRFYAMDNEPDLWADDTHVDIHPARVGYDDLLRLFTDYAGAVKAVDPTAQVTGPVVSGWNGYWFSALDRGSDGFRSAADRAAHGGMPLLPWFLDQVHKHDQQTGQRLLDVLDIHYYPQGQGIYAGKTDRKTAALRLRSTRSLWDPTYEDESWIARSEQKSVQLIPRMKGWIDQYYPGTKLGITEWNWGADDTVNGALAIADVLGIYGREGVYLANYWTNPKLGSPGINAFKMYRNYDGHNTTFGDVSVSASAEPADPNLFSVYASEDTANKQAKIMFVNKSPNVQSAASITLRGGDFRGPARVYQLGDTTNGAIKQLADAPLNASSISYAFPPYSVTLLVIDKAP